MRYSPTGKLARSLVLVAGAANVGMSAENQEATGDGFNKTVGNFDAVASGCDVIPNVIEVRIGLRRADVSPSTGRVLLGGKPGTSALLHLFGKLAH